MFENLEVLANSSSQKEKFIKAANNLLNHCFILKKKMIPVRIIFLLEKTGKFSGHFLI